VIEYEIPTPGGPARAVLTPRAPAGAARPTVLVLGHGAGGGIDARDLLALDKALPAQGVTVVRVEQPWRVAGRRVAGPPPGLDVAWTAVLAHLVAAVPDLRPGRSKRPVARLVVGGRSAGARVACRTAVAVGAVGCLALAFPLHPPGRPERSRVEELTGSGVPTLVVQGERDAFGGPGLFPPGTDLVPVAQADHGFRVPARGPVSQRDALEVLVAGVGRWLAALP
jgi:predicted alpha/beta-hydrolase family hydrolase